MNKVSQVVIVGAGIGGLCAALALAKQGVQVVVCEQALALGEVGAGLQISPNAFKVLRDLGLESALKPFAFVPQNAAIRDYKTGEYYLKIPLAQAAEKRYQAPYWHLHRADLHQVLVDACSAAGVAIWLGAVVSRYQEDTSSGRICAVLQDGRECSADLLIGADGLHSAVRRQMLGPEKPTFMGQVAWRGVIPVSALNVVIQPDACVWAGPGRHLVSYYVRGGEWVNFVAVEERDDWQSESWREEGSIEELKRAFAGWHPEVTELLGSATSTFLWALNGRTELPTWSQGRAVLLGDACHPMLPFMAQGAAMAIEDAAVLVRYVCSFDVADALARYEQVRKPRTTKVQNLSKANAGLYHMHGGVFGKAKLKALKVASRFAPVMVHSTLDDVYGHQLPC
ncbi:FAD-dependent oxidoreductase [Marinomonas sp. IMCC 4694]|uniref:FAD-dependent oxidoreductase n=1 Tax=Marinomonas sp. IMCC 4694 TaxID=2605432 RepID=UPI0011E65059|nr:FAD-dependent oxidoreductase [Marinomonas sp. IMCC 4694]TYL47011.1 NAD(P)-binding protein [Marinomonas sp. IMCC 4694]